MYDWESVTTRRCFVCVSTQGNCSFTCLFLVLKCVSMPFLLILNQLDLTALFFRKLLMCWKSVVLWIVL